MLKLFSNSI